MFGGIDLAMVNTRSKIVAWISRLKKGAVAQSKYVDLAPTDNADETGEYSRALIFATDNPRVSNIALTGPYGSGKSSVIKSFLKIYKRPVLQISLAAFLPEAAATGGNVSKQEIERSILQQMLYGADANKLPLSRFKRIQSPSKWSFLVSICIIIGLFSCWYVFREREKILSGEYFLSKDSANWVSIAFLVCCVIFVCSVIHKIYITSFGLSLKSISLKDIEISPSVTNQDSILNRHLDEIIYFFQSTKYDLVIIEDLDRFNNPEIFVTLREINGLINANVGVRRTIRFLYALRDNMFINTDRTKFFEFILPVIPIISSSNSVDKFLERGEQLSINVRLDRQFIGDVSRYINDLRLIQNIFNEYVTYVSNLEADGESILDANKLLAILVYKNVFPSDFEKLHQGKGNLAKIIGRYDDYVSNVEAKLKAEILRLEEIIDVAEKQVPFDVEELRKIYAMTLMGKMQENFVSVKAGDQQIPLGLMANYQQFDEIIAGDEVFCRTLHGHTQRVIIRGLQSEVHPSKSFHQRKAEIEQKSNEARDKSAKEMREIKLRLSQIRLIRFNEIIRQNLNETEELFLAFGDNAALARFLVLEGYLDDTYYQYTSLFHSGRLSPNDNKFLIQIRGYINPTPDFQVDNPKEVIAAMRNEDFHQKYVLNTAVVDCLMSNPNIYASHLTSFHNYVASNFDECGAFFSSYYVRGKNIAKLMHDLVERWPGFASAAIVGHGSVVHVSAILASLSDLQLKKIQLRCPELSEFISTHLSEILTLGVDFDPVKLKLFRLKVPELSRVSEYVAVVRILAEEGLYELSKENVEVFFNVVLGGGNLEDLQKKHYTTILETENGFLIDRIEKDFEYYLKNVILVSENNTDEDISTVLKVINNTDVGAEYVLEFIKMQSAVLPDLKQVPVQFHSAIFDLQKIEPSWDNCQTYLASDSYDAAVLTNYLCENEPFAVLSKLPVPDGKNAYPLREFLIENDHMSDSNYRTYVRALPKTFNAIPQGLGVKKIKILIEEKKVSFNLNNFSSLESNRDLQVEFVVNNILEYLEKKEEFIVDDDFREVLLSAGIQDDQKLKIIASMDLNSLSGYGSRAGMIGEILERTGADVPGIKADVALTILINSQPVPVQISLFNKFHNLLNDDQVRYTMQKLPEPFSSIKAGWTKPTIKKTEVNVEFVKWLKERGFISSWREERDDIRIHLFRS
jgi:hypothetical protein